MNTLRYKETVRGKGQNRRRKTDDTEEESLYGRVTLDSVRT